MSQGLRNSSSSEEWQAVSFLCCAVITLPGQSCPGMQLPRHTAIPVTARCLLFPSTAALICMCQQIGTARQPRSEASVEGVCGGVGGIRGMEWREGEDRAVVSLACFSIIPWWQKQSPVNSHEGGHTFV